MLVRVLRRVVGSQVRVTQCAEMTKAFRRRLGRGRPAVVGEVQAHGRVRLIRNQLERRLSGFPSIRNQFAAARERVKLIWDLFEPPTGHRRLIWRWTEPLASWLELIWRRALPLVSG